MRHLPLLLMFALAARSAPTAWAEEPMRIDHHDLTYFLGGDGQRLPITTVADWERRRAQTLHGMQLVMGDLPGPPRRVPLDVRVVHEERRDGILFRKLTYVPEPGDRVSAWLLIPDQRTQPAPGILCLHQTTKLGKDEPAGLGGHANLHYALELAQRGYVTLSPDYPTLGEYEWDFAKWPTYASGTMKGIWNHLRAVDLLAALPEVDPQRLGVIGHSLGGHNALFLAPFDTRLQVVISSCGFTRFHKDDLPSWTGDRYMPRIASVYGNDPDRMPFDFAEIVGALAPRAFLAVAATRDDDFDVSGVKEIIDSAKGVYRLYGAEDKLQGLYPESPHDFPPAARKAAYEFLDRQMAALKTKAATGQND